MSHTTGKRGLQLLVFSHYWVVFAFRTVDGINRKRPPESDPVGALGIPTKSVTIRILD